MTSILDEMLARCESPIEEMFLRAAVDRLIPGADALGFVLRVQHEVPPYRLDFAFLGKDGRKVCVELDGHEFHERTKEQAGYDRKRDRFLLLNDWRVVRFTGREVHASAATCAGEVLLHLRHAMALTAGQAALAESIARALVRLTKMTEEKARVKREQFIAEHMRGR